MVIDVKATGLVFFPVRVFVFLQVFHIRNESFSQLVSVVLLYK